MLRPVHVPLAEDQIAGLILHLETALAPSLTLTTLAVRRTSGVESFVIVHLVDGSRHPLSATNARLMARVLRDDYGAIRQFHAWADSLDEAADQADRQAAAILMGMASGEGVRQACDFGGR